MSLALFDSHLPNASQARRGASVSDLRYCVEGEVQVYSFDMIRWLMGRCASTVWSSQISESTLKRCSVHVRVEAESCVYSWKKDS